MHTPGKTLNLANVQKLGQRVGTTLQGPSRRYDGYKEIDPEEILVDKSNRGGAPPHVMYMHCGILAGMKKTGSTPQGPRKAFVSSTSLHKACRASLSTTKGSRVP